MRRLLGFTCAVSLFCSVFAGSRLVADGFVGARQVLRELVAVSKKAGKLGQTVLATTMMVATSFSVVTLPKTLFKVTVQERFLEFLDELADSDAKVLFLSGDRHFTEIMEIPAEVLGYQTYEFTSSPVHSNHRKIPPHNPLRVAGKGSVNNFMLVRSQQIQHGATPEGNFLLCQRRCSLQRRIHDRINRVPSRCMRIYR